jgi:hypothetical protein
VKSGDKSLALELEEKVTTGSRRKLMFYHNSLTVKLKLLIMIEQLKERFKVFESQLNGASKRPLASIKDRCHGGLCQPRFPFCQR